MVNNSTNINKANNYLSHKISENKISPRYNPMEIQVPDWDRHTNVVGLFRLTVYQPSFPVNVHVHACCTFTFIFEYINVVK